MQGSWICSRFSLFSDAFSRIRGKEEVMKKSGSVSIEKKRG